jgi:hypothetical protein
MFFFFSRSEANYTNLISNENNFRLVLSTVRILVVESGQNDEIVKYGQFMASLLPSTSIDENSALNAFSNIETMDLTKLEDKNILNLVYSVKLRNRLLNIIDDLVSQNTTTTKSVQFQEDLQRLLGYDWFLLFMQPNVYKTTIIKSVKILFTMLLNMQHLNRFKESYSSAGWLSNIKAENLTTETSSSTTTTTTTTTPTTTPSLNEFNLEACAAPGFQVMQVFLAKHADFIELYYLLFALLFDTQRIKELPSFPDLNLNNICKYVFDKSFDSEQTLFSKINTELSSDVIIILFSMIRTLMCNQPEESQENEQKIRDYAIILLQIFRFMYHNCDDFNQLTSQSSDFLTALIATLYPKTQQQQQQDSSLSSHPARKLVMDFLRDLIYDNLIADSASVMSSVNKLMGTVQNSLIDTILNTCLPQIDSGGASSSKRNQEFITELFKTIIDYLQASDFFSSENPSSSNSINFNSSTLPNLFNLIERLVDKLWDGAYKRDAKEVFDMCVRFIQNLKRKFSNNLNLIEPMQSSLNRVLLYQLSRSCLSLSEQIEMLDVLHKITKMKSLIFSASNNFQPEFFACVTHCLLQITNNNEDELMKSCESPQSKTQWYSNSLFNGTLNSSFDQESNSGSGAGGGMVNAKYLLVSAAQRVWLDLYLTKKSILEECLKISLDSIGKNPTLDELRPVLEEPAARVWTSFIDGEKKLPEKIQSHIQSKFQRVTGGISNMAGGFNRIVSLKKQKKEVTRLTHKELNDVTCLIVSNLALFKGYMEAEYQKFFLINEQRHLFMYDEWLKIEKDLLREKSLWGDDFENVLNKFKLDFTEGPNRQRKRFLLKNEEFYMNFPYRPELEAIKPSKKYKIPSSYDSKEYYKQFRVQSLINFNENLQQFLQDSARYAQLELQYSSQANLNNTSIDQSVELTSEEQLINQQSLEALKLNLNQNGKL